MKSWSADLRALGAVSALLCASLSGCENNEALAAVQKQADERVALAQKHADEKIAEAQQQIEELKVQAAKAAQEAQAQAKAAIQQAQESADQAQEDATRAVDKARDAYKAEARAKLKGLEDDARDLRAQAAKANAKVKTSVQSSLKEVALLQKQVEDEIKEFDKATVDTFRSIKADVNKHLAALKTKLSSTEKQLK